jgi:PmbA protein
MSVSSGDLDRHLLLDVAQAALTKAKKLGASQSEVSMSSSVGASVGVRKGELETIEHNRDKSVSLSVYFQHKDGGQKTGSASTSDLSISAVEEAVAAACAIASHTGHDDALGLADAELMADDVSDMDLDYPWDGSVDDMREAALECESAATGLDKRIGNTEGANYSSHRGLEVYANSHGFCADYYSTQHGYSVSVIAMEGGEMQRDYWYSSERNPDELDSVESVGVTAAERALQKLGSRRIPTGEYPVIFDATVSGSLISHLLSGISGGLLYKKASFLTDQLGEKIFPETIDIFEHPRLYSAMNSACFDGEGVATPDQRGVVEGGYLRGYVLGSYTARKLDMQSTANSGGVRNVRVSHGDKTRDDLLRDMGTGLLVTDFIGSGINMLTGDYSRGASGFWVEGGEIQFPVHEVTVAGKLPQMFSGFQEIAADSLNRGNIHCGSILLDKLTVAGD